MKPWGEAHRREGRMCLRRCANERDLAGDEVGAELLLVDQWTDADSEDRLRERLESVGIESGYDAKRIDREVRHVRRLAEGLDVRETSERAYVRLTQGAPAHGLSQGEINHQKSAEDARRIAALPGLQAFGPKVVRVTVRSIRSAS